MKALRNLNANATFLHNYYYLINSLQSSFIPVDSLKGTQFKRPQSLNLIVTVAKFHIPYSSHLVFTFVCNSINHTAPVMCRNGEKKVVLKLKRPIFILPMMITNFEIIKYCCETTMTAMQNALSPHRTTENVLS